MAVRVLVDADSCPQRVKKYLLSRAKKAQIQLYFIANRDISDGAAFENFKMIVRPQTAQAADNWIVANAAPGDIVITRDIPLADSLLKKNIRVMNDYGKIFDERNIARALKERELSLQMKELGLGTKKRDSYGQKEFELFAESFNKATQA